MVSYGDMDWFEAKGVPYVHVDYASTMWRPKLRPLPCRVNIRHTTYEDGRDSFVVLDDTVPVNAILDISPCVKVSIIVIDQFPVLWDFVLFGATEPQTVCAREDAVVCWQPSILIRKNISVAGMRPSVIRRANPDHTRS